MTAANAASSFSANAAESASSAQDAKAAAESAADALNVWETYSAAKTYQPLNKVVYDGSSYCCIAESTGHAPTDTNYWLLIAQRGQDGSGTGDMLKLTYDPQNKAQYVFAYADGKAPLVVTITEDDESGEFSSNHDAFEICDAFRAGRVVFANVDEDVWMLDRVFGNRDEYGRAEAFFRYYTLAPTQDANDAWHFGLAHMEISVTTQATDETSTNFETLVGMSTKQIDAIGVGAVPSVGGTMTGALTLSGAPAEDLHAATKKYVDDSVPDVTGKADKAVPSAAGNVAALDASGNLADSGKKPADFAAAGHTHAAGDITSGVVPVANGGTGKSTLTNGYALIGNGTNAVTLRAITDISSSVSTISLSSNLITSRAITNILNRSDTIFSSNTNYATYMARGTSLNSAETTPTKNGTIAWTYE